MYRLLPCALFVASCITFDPVNQGTGVSTGTVTRSNSDDAGVFFAQPNLDFGEVELGQSISRTFDIGVIGTLAQDIVPSLDDQTHYQITATDCAGKGGPCTVTVLFKPKTIGDQQVRLGAGTVDIRADAITLTGRAFDKVSVTITRSGDGSGTLLDPDSMPICSVGACSVDVRRFSMAETRVFTAEPATGSTASFTGCDQQTATTCSIALTGSRSFGSIFSLLSYEITLKNEEELTNTNLRGTTGTMSGLFNGDICFNNCKKTFKHGAPIEISWTMGTEAGVVGWENGPCAGSTESTCSGVATESATITFRFSGKNVAFITTSVQAVGALGSLANADALCAAKGATITSAPNRTWRAFLAGPSVNAWTRLFNEVKNREPRGWISTFPDEPFADFLFDPHPNPLQRELHLFYPPRNEGGGVVSATDKVVIGAQVNGEPAPAAGSFCNNFSTQDITIFPAGKPKMGVPGILDDGANSLICNQDAHLICLSIDFRTQVKPPKPALNAKRAFVSKRPFIASGAGLQAADDACKDDAIDLGYCADRASCTVKAFLANNLTNAAGRFSLGASPWFRPDDVKIADNRTSVTNGDLKAAIDRRADGKAALDPVWTGAISPTNNGTPGSTCDAWNDSGGTGVYGQPSHITQSSQFTYFFLASGGCSTPRSVYCLQD